MPGKRWMQEEVEFLKANYEKLGAKVCTQYLRRTYCAVMGKAYNLGIATSSKSWTNDEIRFLKANYAKLGRKGCAKVLGRSTSSVKGMSQKLRLVMTPEFRREAMIKPHRRRSSPNKISREMLIQELLNLAYVLDRSPKVGELKELSRFSRRPFEREFGSWSQALKAADLLPAPGSDGPPLSDSRHCEACGMPFHPKWKNSRFCSRKCWGAWKSQNWVGENSPIWRGGRFPYGLDWYQQRREARKRDNYTCQQCGITEQELGQHLDVHHIKSVRKFKDSCEANDLANLVSLCRSCHRAMEGRDVLDITQ